MIYTEIISNGTDQFRKTYTDDETKILHKIGTDEYYCEAVDLLDSPYEYEEVDNPDIEESEEENEIR